MIRLTDEETVENLAKLKEVYLLSAERLEEAKREFDSVESEGDKKDFFTLKYMGVIIYNDLSREFFYMESNPSLRLSRILSMTPVIHKLYEAFLWHRKEGNLGLKKLAERRGLSEDVEKKLRSLKSLKAARIEKYKDIRDKLSGHYDARSLRLIDEFCTLSYEELEQDMINVIHYTNGWLQILKYLGHSGVSSPNLT